MLLEEARKHTPHSMSEDVFKLEVTIAEVAKVASHINDRSRETEAKRQVLLWHARFLQPSILCLSPSLP
jgi:hypothetical protein